MHGIFIYIYTYIWLIQFLIDTNLQELLILDEATSALDAETGQFLLESLQELRRRAKRSQRAEKKK